MDTHAGKDRPILLFFGLVLLILGVYGSLKTTVNLLAFDVYPQETVFPFSQVPYGPMSREEDCPITYSYTPPTYFEEDGVTLRSATPAEVAYDEPYRKQMELQALNCVSAVQDARRAALVDDISKSAIFLFLAFLVLAYSRIFKRKLFTIKI